MTINLNKKLKLVFGRVENSVGKGENVNYQHFLLFPQCFQSPLCQGHLESGLYGKGLMEQSCFCMTLKMKAFEYSVEKAENGGN